MNNKITANRVSMVRLKIKDREIQLSPKDFTVLKSEIEKVDQPYAERCLAIQKSVASAFGVSPRLLHEKTRRRDVSEPRGVASYFMAKEGVPAMEIAKFFGFHRTAAEYAFRSVSARIETDKKFAALVNRISASLK